MLPIFEHYNGIIPEFPLFQEVIHRPFIPHLRVNRLKVEPAILVDAFLKKGVNIVSSTKQVDYTFFMPGLYSPGNLPEYFLGYIHPQALTSCLASIILSPKEDSLVLDMCASPGGKTAHMAQIMGNSGLIVANELYPSRHLSLGNTLNRLGILNTVVTSYQAQEFPLGQKFDYVLADVPCSGEGMFRKTRKVMRYKEKMKKGRLPDLQKKIIIRGYDLLKAGGQMLYSTCTYNPDENEAVVNYLLENRDAELLPIEMDLRYSPGIIAWMEKIYDKRIEKTIRLYPHWVDSVGFFMARISKRA